AERRSSRSVNGWPRCLSGFHGTPRDVPPVRASADITRNPSAGDRRSRMRAVVLVTLTFFAFANLDGHASIGHLQGGRNMDSLRGKTLRWTFTDGPAAGTLFEHTF